MISETNDDNAAIMYFATTPLKNDDNALISITLMISSGNYISFWKFHVFVEIVEKNIARGTTYPGY